VSVPSIPLPGRGEYRVALGLPSGIRRDLDAFNPDLVHLSAPDLLGTRAMRYARTRGLPIIASLHTRFETYFGYYGLGRVRRHVERYLDRFYKGCDIVLAPTPTIVDELSAGYPAGAVRLWARGVDPDRFNANWRSDDWRRRQGYSATDVIPLFFGRLVREKGLDRFAEVIRAVRSRGHEVRPLIVGGGPARHWLAARLPNCHFAGHLTGNALSEAVASADILINPSRTEAFGNVVLEAMASGLAVVAADAPSARNLIRSTEMGLLCAEDVNAYADATAHLIESPPARKAMGIAAAKRSQDFGWPETLAAVAHAYLDAIGGGTHATRPSSAATGREAVRGAPDGPRARNDNSRRRGSEQPPGRG
jgi:glycosyltransferase involved in cell wall biosynthesis